jgi:DNA ligase-1
MREFAALYRELDETTKTAVKVATLAEYFGRVPPGEAAWALFYLMGRRPKNLVKRKALLIAALEGSGLPGWLFDECYTAVADLAETISLILPPGSVLGESRPLDWWIEHRLLSMAGKSDEEQAEDLKTVYAELTPEERFVFTKLATGGFRVGVSRELVLRGLSQALGRPPAELAHRLMGEWQPGANWFAVLAAESAPSEDIARPYPFCLAYPVAELSELGEPEKWSAEWKWDGIRAQLIRRRGQTFLWSRGEDLIHESFPDVLALGEALPDGTVLDAEILAWGAGGVMSFQDLQKRLNRRSPSAKMIAATPAALLAFDLLETEGRDLRAVPFQQRRALLERTISGTAIKLSPIVPFSTWDELTALREGSRVMRAEGLMLKGINTPYEGGRRRGIWWKWKVTPFSVDAVMLYAQRGSGKRASLYTDYTFGLWLGDQLVPFAKAYSGLTDEEIREVDGWIRRHTKEKFGPVRTLDPDLVFEIAFEGIQLSNRHKSGVAVRFPRILRWRKDKRATDADHLETVRELLRRREAL